MITSSELQDQINRFAILALLGSLIKLTQDQEAEMARLKNSLIRDSHFRHSLFSATPPLGRAPLHPPTT